MILLLQVHYKSTDELQEALVNELYLQILLIKTTVLVKAPLTLCVLRVIERAFREKKWPTSHHHPFHLQLVRREVKEIPQQMRV